MRLQQWLYRAGAGVLVAGILIAGFGRVAAPQGLSSVTDREETVVSKAATVVDGVTVSVFSGEESLTLESPELGRERGTVDLDTLRQSVAERRVAPPSGTAAEKRWETEISFANRGSIRLGYTAGEDSYGRPEEWLDAEIRYQVFGPASLTAGYRLFNVRDVNSLEAARDALARAELQVRF